MEGSRRDSVAGPHPGVVCLRSPGVRGGDPRKSSRRMERLALTPRSCLSARRVWCTWRRPTGRQARDGVRAASFHLREVSFSCGSARRPGHNCPSDA